MKMFKSAALVAAVVSAPILAKTTDSGFNPAMSVILNGGVSGYSQDEYEIEGLPLGGEAGRPEEGLALNEVELNASANIDDNFYGAVVLGIHEEEGTFELDVEEAYVQTTGLGQGFTVTGGKFYSQIGYLNSQHVHSWDFVDAPLVYRGLLGSQFSDIGLRVNWIAPTDLFVEVGAEYLRGDGYPLGGSGKDGKGGLSAFAHIGGEVGTSNNWQVGLSYLTGDEVAFEIGGHAHGHEEEEEEAPSFAGETKVVGLDFVWKWAPNGNSKQRNFKFQMEWLARTLDGNVTIPEHTDGGVTNPEETVAFDVKNSGYYAQAIYQFMPRWRAGYRYDTLTADISSDKDEAEEAGFTDEHDPSRHTIMVDYSPSEFSRFRVQFAQDKSGHETDDQWFLQYVHSIGAHGAHKF